MRPILTKRRGWSLAVLASASLAACAGGPTLDRWTRATEQAGVDPAADALQLYVSSAPAADDTPPLSIRSLPDHAGAALIAGLAARDASAAALRADVARPLAAPSTGGVADTTKLARVMLLGVQRGAYRPGDRLLATTISIRPTAGARFTDYSLAATDRTAINIGAVSVTDQRSGNIAVAPGPVAALAEGLSAGFAASRTQTGSRNIVANTELSVHVAPDEIDAYRTGAEGLDLTGNTLIKLALQLPTRDARTYMLGAPILIDDAGKPLPPEKVTMDTGRITLDAARDLYVCARLIYTDRVITGGRASYDEGRQTVTLRSGASPWTPFLIVPSQDLETPLWVVASGHGVVFFDDHIRRSQLTFDDPAAAEDFTRWLRTNRRSRLANGDLSAGTVDQVDPIAFGDLGVRRLPQTAGVSTVPSCG